MMLRRIVLLISLGASTMLAIILGVTDPTGTPGYPTRFMIWNLFLAWMPLLLAVWFSRLHQRWAIAVVGIAWLGFLPNAVYLVTDLTHLGGSTANLWRHILQFGIAAWTGTMLGVVSLRIVHTCIERRFGRVVGWGMVAASTALCAVGVVIGRFQRWNSWDIIVRPADVAASTFDWVRSPISDVRSTGVAGAVGLFFVLAYLIIWSLDGWVADSAERAA